MIKYKDYASATKCFIFIMNNIEELKEHKNMFLLKNK